MLNVTVYLPSLSFLSGKPLDLLLYFKQLKQLYSIIFLAVQSFLAVN